MSRRFRIIPARWVGRLLGVALLPALVSTAPLIAQPLGFEVSGESPGLRIGDVRRAHVPAGAGDGQQATTLVHVPVYVSRAESSNYVRLSVFYDDRTLSYRRVATGNPEWRLSPFLGFREEAEGRVSGAFLRRDAADVYGGDAPPPAEAKGAETEGGAGEAADGQAAVDKGQKDGEELVFEIVYVVRDLSGRDPDLPFLRTSLSFTPGGAQGFIGGSVDSFVGNVRDVEGNARVEWQPTALDPGSVTFYFESFLEVGSGEMTRATQSFAVPLFLTHLEPVDLVSIGVDYDELILRGVRPVGPLVVRDAVAVDAPEPGSSASFSLRIHPDAADEVILGAHVADLVFEYLGSAAPDAGALRISPHFRDAQNPGGGEGGGAALESRSIPGLVRFVEPHFVRGNVDGSRRGGLGVDVAAEHEYAPDFSDALQILMRLFGGRSEPLGCLEAADMDDGGVVDVSDAVYLLSYLFLGDDAPAAPFPLVGPDPRDSLTHLGCDQPLPYFSPVGD
ncbi:MAG: hypothetical protein O7J95_19230 [Planctomycetota bacterium]|nr:hypothetical protein [Planctomycetota bacterium]